MKEIVNELKDFLKLEWWVFIIFLICLVFIFLTKTWNIWEILIIFFFHCLADVFMMTMWKYYSSWDLRKWSIFQFFWNWIFVFIWLYSGFFNWNWNYTIAQLWFTFSALKNYFVNIKWKKVKFLNWKVLLAVMFIVSLNYFYFWFVTSIWVFIQFLWFVIFPLWLVIDHHKLKYFFSLFWVFILTIWTFIILYESYLRWNIFWVDISFALLPLTVFVSYVKRIRDFI